MFQIISEAVSGKLALDMISWTACARSVMTAIDPSYDQMDDFALIEELRKTSKIPVPNAIREILDAQIRHDHVCGIDEMEAAVKGFLKV